jgi:hypothetical protein
MWLTDAEWFRGQVGDKEYSSNGSWGRRGAAGSVSQEVLSSSADGVGNG